MELILSAVLETPKSTSAATSAMAPSTKTALKIKSIIVCICFVNISSYSDISQHLVFEPEKLENHSSCRAQD